MRKAIGLLVASMLVCGAARAQVINGEGDYEGSSLHTPPPKTDVDMTPATDGRQKPNESKKPRQDERK